MNESNFANYDNYFCSTNLQVSIDNSLLQNMDFDMPQTSVHNYMTNVSCDLPLSSTSVDQRLGSNGCYPFLAHSRDEQEKLKDPATNLCVTASTGVVSSAATSVFANIPFVQIHTTDVQPQRTSYGNVFRRNISKQEEIKFEPIKSENSESVKERTNATPTPPRAAASTQHTTAVGIGTSQEESCEADTQCESTAPSDVLNGNHFQIFKCSKCPFLALKEIERNKHLATQHEREEAVHEVSKRAQINCPGCSNIFFMPQSLDIHLRLDHIMSDDDASKLLSYITNIKPLESQSKTKKCSDSTPVADDNTLKEPLRKSRIYLKNVDCLREPNRQPIEQTENQLSEHNINSIEIETKAPSKQKISIKSVDVLREPALLRRDYELENVGYNNYINVKENMCDQMSLNVPTTYEYDQNTDPLTANTCNMNNNNLNMADSNEKVATEPAQKPRRPKIYVKSVESFNLMPLDSIRSSNNDFLGDHNNLCNVSSSQGYDANVGHLPFMYETNTATNSMTSNGNYINNNSEIEPAYQYMNNSSQVNSNYILENSLYANVHVDGISINAEQLENVPLGIEQSSPPPNMPNSGNDNFSMNKSPHPIHEQRGTLHLRTVDELNLMNKNEVQHLIAPHLDNNHNGELSPKDDQTLSINVDLIGDTLYETEGFKFQDLDSQMVNGWPETYEDLDEDISGILTEVTNGTNRESSAYNPESTHKNMYNNLDIDTPQMSMITIRDIEELTGGGNAVTVPQYIHSETDNHTEESILEEIPLITTEQIENISVTHEITLNLTNPPIENTENLKRELSNGTPESRDSPTLTATYRSTETPQNNAVFDTGSMPSGTELPPLVPVTNPLLNKPNTSTSPQNTPSTSTVNNDIPAPILVPVPPLIKINKTIAKPPPTSSPVEKGRIYVANNLMEPSKRPVAVAATCGTSVRGRPYGSNRTRITQLKQLHGNTAEDFFVKCTLKGCAFRFKLPETMEYHKKCHDVSSTNLQATICPECKSTEFNNWNTLHTHLWRAHQVDMELYKCELCDFKTPIFSRLVNTHAKIHFDDRNYKCEQCGKGFKNSKQLKNHRRWHRVQTANATTPKETPTEILQCADCGSTFSLQKTLREHCCKKSESSLKCDICHKVMSTKASLKLHLLTHSDGEKRYKCLQCDYATNDHNAFRRHRMTHENKKMYECQFCEYKSVQSVAYQKHVQQKHPDKADTVIHKCNDCPFSTINRSLLIFHQAKHKTVKVDAINSNGLQENPIAEMPKVVAADLQKSKIKVKSNLFTTTSDQTGIHVITNDFNTVQLFINTNTNGVT